MSLGWSVRLLLLAELITLRSVMLSVSETGDALSQDAGYLAFVPGEVLKLHTYFLWHTKITGFAMTTVAGSLFSRLLSPQDLSTRFRMGFCLTIAFTRFSMTTMCQSIQTIITRLSVSMSTDLVWRGGISTNGSVTILIGQSTSCCAGISGRQSWRI